MPARHPTSYDKAARSQSASDWLFTALIASLVCTTFGSLPAAEEISGHELLEERNRIVDQVQREGVESIPKLRDAITSENEILRYTAAHLLLDLGEPAYQVLSENINHDDSRIRYVVMGGLESLDVVGDYVEEFVTDDDAVIRRRFYLHTMPRYLLVDGAPTEALIKSLAAAYDMAPDEIRHEIVKAVADLPLTPSSIALLQRASDREKAVVAAEEGQAEVSHAQEMALVAFQRLLESDIERMRHLADEGNWEELVAEFEDRDFTTWPDTDGRGRGVPGLGYANHIAEASYWLAQAYVELGQGQEAEELLARLINGEIASVGIAHRRERLFYSRILDLYRQNYQANLEGNEMVRDRYVQMELSHGNRLVEAGRTEEARARYESGLEIEGTSESLRQSLEEAITGLGPDS